MNRRFELGSTWLLSLFFGFCLLAPVGCKSELEQRITNIEREILWIKVDIQELIYKDSKYHQLCEDYSRVKKYTKPSFKVSHNSNGVTIRCVFLNKYGASDWTDMDKLDAFEAGQTKNCERCGE